MESEIKDDEVGMGDGVRTCADRAWASVAIYIGVDVEEDIEIVEIVCAPTYSEE